MLSLIIKSRNKKAEEINYWITHEVMPAIRNNGEYKMKHEYKKQIDELKIIIDNKVQENEILKHNLKKQKFIKNSIVYIIAVSMIL